MKILFLISGEHELAVFVDEERNVFFRGELTGDKKVSYDTLVSSSGQSGKVEAELFKAIVRDLRSLSDVEKYIVHEILNEPGLRAVGVELLRTEV